MGFDPQNLTFYLLFMELYFDIKSKVRFKTYYIDKKKPLKIN